MSESDLERTLDAALQDRDWLALTLTDVRENEEELRHVLDRAFGAAERHRSALTEIQLRKSRFSASALTSYRIPVTECGEAGILRLIFQRRHSGSAPGRLPEPPVKPTASSDRRSCLFLSIALNPG